MLQNNIVIFCTYMTSHYQTVLYLYNRQITSSKGIIFHIFHTARILGEVKQWVFRELSLHLGVLLKTSSGLLKVTMQESFRNRRSLV